MGDYIAIKRKNVQIQENGIIRDENDRIIGRLLREVSFEEIVESFSIDGLKENDKN